MGRPRGRGKAKQRRNDAEVRPVANLIRLRKAHLSLNAGETPCSLAPSLSYPPHPTPGHPTPHT
ncbi:hypothetical protein [Moorena producens]|uniref:hypothetical protein n=1 Tax=Moorena producens TaxID=1155739 RepID=UPI003C7610CA